jgi:hypothetical protein
MKHPEILLLPVLMLMDYYMTIWGAVLRDKNYSEHFKTEHYELNPVWQNAVGLKKWFNPKHLLITVFCSAFFAVYLQLDQISEQVVEMVLGFLFCFFGMVIGAHVANLVTFYRLNRNPEDISGQVTMSHGFLLSMSVSRYWLAGVPLAMVAIFSPTPFTLGALAAVLGLVVLHLSWMRKHRKALAKSKIANKSESERRAVP